MLNITIVVAVINSDNDFRYLHVFVCHKVLSSSTCDCRFLFRVET